jgi:release factor glutamine methyltransferase
LKIDEILAWSRQQFPLTADWEREIRILLGSTLGKDSAALLAHGEHVVSDKQLKDFEEKLEQRRRGIPIAYLTGTREFWSLPIAVNNQVLIPRHETELLVERLLELVGKVRSPSILELGTGSGAVAIALGSELRNARITATDKFDSSLTVALQNLDASGLKNIEIIKSDWFDSLDGEQFDFICSNPPYISADDEHLQQGDVRFEPRHALVAADCGYESIRTIVTNAENFLSPGGMIVLEHGFEQGETVRQMLLKSGYGSVKTYQDLVGNDRVSEGKAG